MRAKRKQVKTYLRLYGVDFGSSTEAALHFAVGGKWLSVPRSVVHSFDITLKEMVVEEWWAKSKGLA